MSDMRLIDANALKTKQKTVYMEFDNVVVPTKVIPISDLYLAPTIDAVPVVRCKDCAYRNVPNCCPYQINGFKITHDWYCPMGVTEVHND